MTEQQTDVEHLVKNVELTREVAERILEDEDLWLLIPEQRFAYEGEEDVRQWQMAADFAYSLSQDFTESTAINDATRQMLWDLRERAEEALRRAHRRSERQS